MVPSSSELLMRRSDRCTTSANRSLNGALFAVADKALEVDPLDLEPPLHTLGLMPA
jgi:hypothetical protein